MEASLSLCPRLPSTQVSHFAYSSSRDASGADTAPASYCENCIASLPQARLEAVRLGDDLLHDLVRTGADPPQTRVAPCPLDGELVHVPVPAKDLDCIVGDLDRDLRGEQLGLRDLPHWVLAFVPLRGRLVDEGLHRRDLGAHVDEPLLDDLELGDRLAKGLPLLHLVHAL